MAEALKKIGWRKLSAWFIIQAVATYLAILAFDNHMIMDLPDNLLDLMKWNAGFFFLGNVLEHGIKNKFSVSAGAK